MKVTTKVQRGPTTVIHEAYTCAPREIWFSDLKNAANAKLVIVFLGQSPLLVDPLSFSATVEKEKDKGLCTRLREVCKSYLGVTLTHLSDSLIVLYHAISGTPPTTASVHFQCTI